MGNSDKISKQTILICCTAILCTVILSISLFNLSNSRRYVRFGSSGAYFLDTKKCAICYKSGDEFKYDSFVK